MKQNYKKLFYGTLVLLVCLFAGASSVYALELPLNMPYSTNADVAETRFTLYMPEEALENHSNYYHVEPAYVADKEKEVYLKFTLDEPTEMWTELSKGGLAGGGINCDLLAADKKTVIHQQRVTYVALHRLQVVLRGVFPSGTYYYHLYNSYEEDCVCWTDYFFRVPVFKSFSEDDDKIQSNNTKATAFRLEENEEVSGYLDFMGTDPADWYTFTVTDQKGILHFECSSGAGMNCVLLRADGNEVAGGGELPYKDIIELTPGRYYLGLEFEETSDVYASRSYSVWFEQEMLPTGLELNRTELTMYTDDFVSIFASVVPEGARGVTVKWSSSDDSVVTVADYSDIDSPSTRKNTNIYSREKSGTAYITVETTDGTNLSATCKVTVINRSDYSSDYDWPGSDTTDTSTWYISFKYTQLSLHPGEDTYIEYNCRGSGKPVFVSSDPKIVTADEWHITAVNPGQAIITASFPDAPEIKAQCRVTVNESYDSSYRSDNETGSATIKAQKATVKKGNKTTVKITSNSGGKITIKGNSKNAKNKKYVKISGSKVIFQKKAPRGTYKFKVTCAAKGVFRKTDKMIIIKVK